VDIGLQTTLVDDGWQTLYSKLAAFKQRHGHTQVPTDSVIGPWVAVQRVELSGFLEAGKNMAPVPELVELRIAKLIDIGFEFYSGFDTHLFELGKFKETFGHTNVPLDYICKDNKVGLGAWVSEQRVELSGYLQAERRIDNRFQHTYSIAFGN
jgi:Helicase associated domain